MHPSINESIYSLFEVETQKKRKETVPNMFYNGEVSPVQNLRVFLPGTPRKPVACVRGLPRGYRQKNSQILHCGTSYFIISMLWFVLTHDLCQFIYLQMWRLVSKARHHEVKTKSR